MSSSIPKELPKDLTSAVQALRVVAKPVIQFLTIAIPFLVTTTRSVWKQYKKLPQNALLFLYGVVFCFFGGIFPTLFSALQAAEYGGRKTVMTAISDLADEAMIIVNESKKDDVVDEDKDGKNDVSELSGTELVQRKTLLILRKMNPEKIDKALSAMYRVWLSVAAVLSVEFARIISMSLAIADFLNKPVNRFITPTIQVLIPDEYDRWVPVLMSWMTKSIAMSISWYIGSVLAATSSALKGGLMMAQACYYACIHRGITLGGWIPDNHTETTVDEVLSYLFAGLGFYVQFNSGFALPPVLRILFWPLELVEYYIRWSITNKKI